MILRVLQFSLELDNMFLVQLRTVSSILAIPTPHFLIILSCPKEEIRGSSP
jgi:hypothetical protein